MEYKFNDGGRSTAGYKGFTGDCVCRAIAIAAELPYQKVYDLLAYGNYWQRKTKRSSKVTGRKTAAHGINVTRKWFKDLMANMGFLWVPTMTIGSGCKVHLDQNELPSGRLVVAVSKHYTCVIDGVIHDTYDPQRLETGIGENGELYNIPRRCVYGYYIKQ